VTDSWVTQTSLFRPTSTSRDLGAIRVKPQSFVHGRLMHAVFQHVEIQRLNGTTAYRTVTDADGDYRFRGLAPGPYRIAAGGNGTGWLPFLSPVIELRARHDSVVDGTLRRGATIHGVLSARGKPVAFTDVLVRREGADGGLVAATTTDRAGRYRVSGMAPATYTVGILYDGTAYQHKGVRVVVPTLRASVEAPIAVRKGATITVQFRRDGKRVASARDELRDSKGRWVAGLHNVDGQATYTGLRPGTYTIVGAEHSRFGRTVVTVRAGQTYDAGVVRLSRPTLTLTGTTAPSAVVEAFSGNNCPPDGAFRPGTFDQLATADASGRFRLSGLVPGRYMLGADGWPQNYVPRCVSDVSVRQDRTYDLPLQAGGTVTGRLVYAATGTPAITTLSYELTYPAGSSSNPTAEHPARAQTRQASGVFAIRGLRAATVTGALAQGAELDQINDPSYFVIYPFQDGTPYYLTSEPRAITIGAGSEVQLGDIPLTLHS
jgi:protocatechuate 3,4-dioxygenase beta subunit